MAPTGNHPAKMNPLLAGFPAIGGWHQLEKWWWMAPIGKMVVQGDGGEGIGQCRILKYQTNG
jgi:hypothetical protein